MMYTTTLRRTRKMSRRQAVSDLLCSWGLPHSADELERGAQHLLDGDVEVTEDVTVEHRFKVGDRIVWCNRRVTVVGLTWTKMGEPAYNLDGYVHSQIVSSVDRAAILVSPPKVVYTITVEDTHTGIPVANSDLRRLIESSPVGFLRVTDIKSEVVS